MNECFFISLGVQFNTYGLELLTKMDPEGVVSGLLLQSLATDSHQLVSTTIATCINADIPAHKRQQQPALNGSSDAAMVSAVFIDVATA